MAARSPHHPRLPSALLGGILPRTAWCVSVGLTVALSCSANSIWIPRNAREIIARFRHDWPGTSPLHRECLRRCLQLEIAKILHSDIVTPYYSPSPRVLRDLRLELSRTTRPICSLDVQANAQKLRPRVPQQSFAPGILLDRSQYLARLLGDAQDHVARQRSWAEDSGNHSRSRLIRRAHRAEGRRLLGALGSLLEQSPKRLNTVESYLQETDNPAWLSDPVPPLPLISAAPHTAPDESQRHAAEAWLDQLEELDILEAPLREPNYFPRLDSKLRHLRAMFDSVRREELTEKPPCSSE